MNHTINKSISKVNVKKTCGMLYNKKNLKINPKNTLIIIDWDDTLYPTSWAVSNGIDLTDPNSRYKYIKYFEQLDAQLETTLTHILTLGDVLIITNAMLEWIELASSVLPKTRKCLINIEVISARMKYQNHSEMSEWKKNAFLEEILKRSKKHKYINIMSLGDADFEHNALINLYDLKIIPHKYLKSIKFIRSSDYEVVLEQIKMIRRYITDICKMTRQVDLTFDTL